MATSETTNLQLVKYGAGTDNFIRTDYNGNLDKIDTFAGTTNQAITNLNTQIANCLYYGEVQNKSISLNQTSDIVYVADFSDLTAPSVSGRTFIGYVGYIDSYRAAVLGFGGTRCYYLISAPTTADVTVKVYPVYK